jgi:GT2 family glycosyltransferase
MPDAAVERLAMETDVSVIVVTYNSAPCIKECLDSVLAQEGVRLEVIVVDNVSADETVSVVRAMGAGIRVLANQENVGFGRGCNQGFGASCGRFILLLNPDARLPQRDSLARLCQAMERNPRWGLAGTRVTEAGGAVECPPSFSYPDERRAHCDFSHLPGKIAWVFGASMFIRRDVFAAVEGFDPGFFLSSEETDLCLRIRQHGWEIGFVREITAEHIGAASERGIDPYDTWRRRVPGIYRFWSKHYPAADARRLVRRDWLRATFRKHSYAVLAWFAGSDSRAWRQQRRYAGISAAARLFLEAPPGTSPTLDGSAPARRHEGVAADPGAS